MNRISKILGRRLADALVTGLIAFALFYCASEATGEVKTIDEITVIEAGEEDEAVRSTVTRIYDMQWTSPVHDWGLAEDDWGLEETKPMDASTMSEQSKYATSQLRTHTRVQKDMQLLSDTAGGVLVRVIGKDGGMMIVKGNLASVERFEKLLDTYQSMHSYTRISVAVHGYLISAETEGLASLIRMKHQTMGQVETADLKQRLSELSDSAVIQMIGQAIEGSGCSWVTRVGRKWVIAMSGSDESELEDVDLTGYARAKLKVFNINDDSEARIGITMGLAMVNEDTTAAAAETVESQDDDDDVYRRRRYGSENKKEKKQQWLEKWFDLGSARYRSISEVTLPGSLIVVQSMQWNRNTLSEGNHNPAATEDSNTQLIVWVIELNQ